MEGRRERDEGEEGERKQSGKEEDVNNLSCSHFQTHSSLNTQNKSEDTS